jgi:hypothetical protein
MACATSSAGGGDCASTCSVSGIKCESSSNCCYPLTCQGVLTPLSGSLTGNISPILGTCQ